MDKLAAYKLTSKAYIFVSKISSAPTANTAVQKREIFKITSKYAPAHGNVPVVNSK
jgi:hypothetical protein